jgi:3-hydroxyisobutyrate dehydrogenase-like beta-hydroxyacid dehydrogenase
MRNSPGDLGHSQIFFGNVVLALPDGTIHNRDTVGFGIAADAAAETARQAHQVRVFQRFIRPGQRPPPQAKSARIVPHPVISVQHDPVHAIVATGQQVRIVIAQRARHISQLTTSC